MRAPTANELYGDAREMSGETVGGNDKLIGGDRTYTDNMLYGDAETMRDFAVGGNDMLIGRGR